MLLRGPCSFRARLTSASTGANEWCGEKQRRIVCAICNSYTIKT